jgi:hypothetical protein
LSKRDPGSLPDAAGGGGGHGLANPNRVIHRSQVYWNKMDGITVITERISCLQLSSFEEAITMNIYPHEDGGTGRLGIQIESGSPAPIGQHEQDLPAHAADKYQRGSI